MIKCAPRSRACLDKPVTGRTSSDQDQVTLTGRAALSSKQIEEVAPQTISHLVLVFHCNLGTKVFFPLLDRAVKGALIRIVRNILCMKVFAMCRASPLHASNQPFDAMRRYFG